MKTFFWSPRRKIGDLRKNLCCSITGNSARRSHRTCTAKVCNKQAVWKLLSKISRTTPGSSTGVLTLKQHIDDEVGTVTLATGKELSVGVALAELIAAEKNWVDSEELIVAGLDCLEDFHENGHPSVGQ